MEVEKEVKKRGRKPKQKYIVNDNPIFDNKNDPQIIINIKKSKLLNYTLDNLDNYSNNICNIDNIDNNIDKFCINCNCKLSNNYISLPIKFINNIFYLYGHFCNYKCCKKYTLNHYKYNKYEIYSYINLICNLDIDNIKFKIINDNINIDNNKILYKNKNLKLYRSKKDKYDILSIINKEL